MRELLLGLFALNALVFLLYGWDKLCAVRGARRVPERWLLLPAAAGGCAGAWLGCEVFRHKTRKPSFRRKLALATAVNGLWLWAWLRPVS